MKIQWNKVTWYSWLAAVVLFFGVFFLGIYIGVQYKAYEMYRQNLTAPPVTAYENEEEKNTEGELNSGTEKNADEVTKSTIEPNDVAGVYTASFTTEAEVQKTISINLTKHRPTVGGARASITIKAEDGEEFTLLGGWELTEEGNVYVTGEPTVSADGGGDDVGRVLFDIQSDTLAAVDYDQSIFDFETLVFERSPE